MKKVLSIVLILAISICSLAAIPVSAEAETDSASNMTWTALRGTWNIGAGSATCTSVSGNRFVFSAERTKRTDNWSLSLDVKKTAVSDNAAIAAGGQDFYFGRVENGFSTSKAYMHITITTDSKMALFYNVGGGTDTRIGRWNALPDGTDLNSYNIKISVVNLKFYCSINDTVIAIYDISSADYNYSDGCFGIIPTVSDTFTTTFSNYHFSVNNDPVSITGGYFIPWDKGFRTVNNTQKWNTAYFGENTVGKYAELNLDYKYLSGNDFGVIRFGDTSTADNNDYYELRLEIPDNTGRNFGLWHISSDGNTKISVSKLTDKQIADLKAFNVKIKLSPVNCKIYIDGVSVINADIDYNGGKSALQTLYTAALFNNIEINTDFVNTVPKMAAGRATTANADGSMTTSGENATWSRIIVQNLDTSKDFEVSYNFVHTAGNYQWNMYFGTSSTNVDSITDGYYVAVNYTDNGIADDIIIYDASKNSRISGRIAFPDTSDVNNFNFVIKYLNGWVRMYVDGQFVGTSGEKLEMPGANCYVRSRQCESTVSMPYAGTITDMGYDINFDNEFNSKDLVKLRTYLLGLTNIIDDVVADYDKDNNITVLDLIRVKKILAGAAGFEGYTETSSENCCYQYLGNFDVVKAGNDFNSNKPFLYLQTFGTDIGFNFAGYETKMGVYFTNNYTVNEVGYIIADGNQTLNTDDMVIDSTVLAVEKAVFADVNDFAEYRIIVKDTETEKTIRSYAKITDKDGKESYIYSKDCIALTPRFQDTVAAPFETVTPAAPVEVTMAAFNNETKYDYGNLDVEQIIIHNPSEEWGYAHGAQIAYINGTYYCAWSITKLNEADPGTRIMISSSKDGKVWNEPTLAGNVPGYAESGVQYSYSLLGIYEVDNKLVISYRIDELDKEAVDDNGLRKAGYGDEYIRKIGYASVESIDHGRTWSSSEYCQGVAYKATELNNGRIISWANRYTDDLTLKSEWNTFKVDFSAAANDGAKIITEPFGFQADDGTLRVFVRTDIGYLYGAESYDGGATWTKGVKTNFTNENSMFKFGRLSDGRYYYVGNPVFNSNRWPLALLISEDGINFNQWYTIEDDKPERQFAGMYKSGYYGYPGVLEKGGKLYVAYSMNKEQIAVSIIDIASIDKAKLVEKN